MEQLQDIEFGFATIKDADEILSLIRQLEHFISEDVLLSNLQTYYNRDDFFLLVARKEEQAIAFAEIHLMHFIHEEKSRARLSIFCVDEKYRNQKLGAKFLTYIEDFCKEKNVFKVEVTSNNRRVNAHRFYETNGFDSSSRVFFKLL